MPIQLFYHTLAAGALMVIYSFYTLASVGRPRKRIRRTIASIVTVILIVTSTLAYGLADDPRILVLVVTFLPLISNVFCLTVHQEVCATTRESLLSSIVAICVSFTVFVIDGIVYATGGVI